MTPAPEVVNIPTFTNKNYQNHVSLTIWCSEVEMELRSKKEKEQEKTMATLTEERSELEQPSTPGQLEEEMTDVRVRMQSGRARSEEGHRRQDETEDGRGDVPSARATSPLLGKSTAPRARTTDEFEQ